MQATARLGHVAHDLVVLLTVSNPVVGRRAADGSGSGSGSPVAQSALWAGFRGRFAGAATRYLKAFGRCFSSSQARDQVAGRVALALPSCVPLPVALPHPTRISITVSDRVAGGVHGVRGVRTAGFPMGRWGVRTRAHTSRLVTVRVQISVSSVVSDWSSSQAWNACFGMIQREPSCLAGISPRRSRV